MTISEGVLVEIERRALQMELRSTDEDGEPVDHLGLAVAADVERLAALVRSLQEKVERVG